MTSATYRPCWVNARSLKLANPICKSLIWDAAEYYIGLATVKSYIVLKYLHFRTESESTLGSSRLCSSNTLSRVNFAFPSANQDFCRILFIIPHLLRVTLTLCHAKKCHLYLSTSNAQTFPARRILTTARRIFSR